MPGENCAIFGCPVNRRSKFDGLSLFKLPGLSGLGFGKSDSEQKEWRDNFLSKITRDRVIDESFKKKIEKGTVHVCEKHFEPSDIIQGKGKVFHIQIIREELDLRFRSFNV